MLRAARATVVALACIAAHANVALGVELSKCAKHGEDEMTKCLLALEARQRQEIGRVGGVIKKQSDNRSFSLIFDASARAWLSFRNAECDMATFESRDGSGYPAILTTCLIEMNEHRISDLKDKANKP